jgi:hypothetical protein
MSKGIDLDQAGEVTAREDAGITVHIRGADGEPAYQGDRPVTIRIAGTYSQVYRKTQDQQTRRLLKQRSRDLSPEQLTANRVELVAASILGWEGFTNKGEAYPCTRENAVALLTRAPWIREQLEEAQQDHAGFSGRASAS